VNTDPIADLLTRVRNASSARHSSVTVPYSKLKEAICGVLKEEGFVRDFMSQKSGPQRQLKLFLIYGEKSTPAITGVQRVSKPSLRIYSGHNEVPRVYGGLGMTIVSTPKGLMTGSRAWREKVGGEVLCVIW